MSSDYSNQWPTYYIPPRQVELETPLEFDARLWAAYWHRGQVRKYTAEPYVDHPAEVVALVRSVPHTDEMIAAAWLHDVVEDTEATLEDIADIFHDLSIMELVQQLTDKSKPEDGNRATRKTIDANHYAKACAAAKTIKLADVISNSKSILERDENFAKVYLPEKRFLLRFLHGGDPTLWAEADRICREAGY